MHALPGALPVLNLANDRLLYGIRPQDLALVVKAVKRPGLCLMARYCVLHGGRGALADQALFHLRESLQHGEKHLSDRGRHRLPP
jgi:hypothetical protein